MNRWRLVTDELPLWRYRQRGTQRILVVLAVSDDTTLLLVKRVVVDGVEASLSEARVRTAIGIIGHSGAGKTTLARTLAQAIPGADIVSFGDAVRDRATAEGADPGDRSVLMRLGQSWVDTDVEGYCRTVLSRRRDNTEVLIIEGVRHEVVRSTLKTLLNPVDLTCVLLKAPYEVMVERMESDHETRTADAQQVLTHPTETQVDQLLLGAADLILDATMSAASNVQEVLDWLKARDRRARGEMPVDYFSSFEPDVFDAKERANLVNAVSTEFDMLLLREVSGRVSLSVDRLLQLRESRRFVALNHSGKLLAPGFQLREGELDQDVSEVIALLSREMTGWEIVAWMISNNGILDGARPVDLTRGELLSAAQKELEA